jgi:nucleoid-associated protein YgaU
MANSGGRIAAGLVVLSAVWIGVYWWWPVEPAIRFETPSETERGVAERTKVASVTQPEAVKTLAAAPTPPAVMLRPEPVASDAQAGVIAPTFTEDVIRSGDTFATIAQRHYGDSGKADVIARANPLMSAANLREGRVVRVPRDPSNVQGLPVVKTAAGEVKPAPVQESKPVATQEYTVQKGDSLAKIARRVYGEERMADMIFQANRDVLTDPAKIRVGQKLKIPAKPAGLADAEGNGGGT